MNEKIEQYILCHFNEGCSGFFLTINIGYILLLNKDIKMLIEECWYGLTVTAIVHCNHVESCTSVEYLKQTYAVWWEYK